jgi:pterin-4a-carbinolamine dehydratase
MTETLAEKTCTPCRGGVPPLARDEALHFQKQAPDWELRDDAHRIERTFRFRNFREALAFVRQVGELAETEGHARSAGSDSNRNSAVTLRDADGFVATGGVSTFPSFSRDEYPRRHRFRSPLNDEDSSD